MNFPCPNHIISCPNGDAESDILGNFTAELPDKVTFWGWAYPGPPGRQAPAFCVSDVSLADANQCATRRLIDNNPDLPPPLPSNTIQQCTVTCPDGTVITVTVAQSTFFASNTGAANALAQSYACDAASASCPDLFTSSAQTCTVTCEDLSTKSYTAGAGMFSGLTQADADAAAASFACFVANTMCTNGGLTPPVFFSTAQTCQFTCPSGQSITVTVRAGLFPGLSQSEADGTAHAFACALAAALCSGLPPLVGNTAQTCSRACFGTTVQYTVNAGTFQAADQATANAIANAYACQIVQGVCEGILPPTVLSRQVPSGNSAQHCAFTCANGTVFTFLVPSNTFVADSLAAANAVAASYACQQAALRARCLSDITTGICVNGAYATTISASGAGGAVSLSLSGTLPPGLSFIVNSISGIPTTPGTYNFTINGQTQEGYTLSRSYSITVAEITSTTLPEASIDTPYGTALTQVGMISPVWTLDSGTLPAGLVMNDGGVISGTPATGASSSTFVVRATQGTLSCTQTVTLPVASHYQWWTMNEAAGNRVDVITGVALVPFNNVTAVPGEISNAVQLEQDSTPDPVAALQSALTTLLAYDGHGLSIVFWLWVDTVLGDDVSSFFRITYFPAVGASLTAVRVFPTVVGPTPYIAAAISGSQGSGSAEMPLVQVGLPRLYAICIDANGTIDFYRDAVLVDSQPGVAGATAAVKGQIRIEANNGGIIGEQSIWWIDELGVFQRKLNASEVAYIYNGGAGRTAPIVFP